MADTPLPAQKVIAVAIEPLESRGQVVASRHLLARKPIVSIDVGKSKALRCLIRRNVRNIPTTPSTVIEH